MEEIEEKIFKEMKLEAFLIFIRSVLINIHMKNKNMNSIKALIVMINEELLEIKKKEKE